MEAFDIEEGDDVVLTFLGDTLLEVFEHEDEDMFDPFEMFVKKGEEIEGVVFSVDEKNFGLQFDDGSVTFIHKGTIDKFTLL
jgi:hypothetical protein